MSTSQPNTEPQPPNQKPSPRRNGYPTQLNVLFSEPPAIDGDPVETPAETAALRARIAELETQLAAQAAAQPLAIAPENRTTQHIDDERYRDLFDNTANLIQNVAMDGSFIYVNRAWLDTLGYSKEEVASLNLFNIIHPDSQNHCMTLFQQIQQGSQSVFVEAEFLTKSGQPISIEGTTSTLFKDGKPVSTRGIFVNVTGRKQVETLYYLSQQIAAHVEPEEVYAATRQAVEQLMPADAFFIALINEARTAIEDAYMYDRGQRWPNERTPLEQGGIAVHVVTTGQLVWIKDDVVEPSPIAGQVLYGTGDQPRSILAVPLQSGGKTIGALSAQSYQPNAYTENHLQLLTTLATSVAGAIERARILESLQASELSLRTLTQSANDAIVTADNHGKIVGWNEGAQRIFQHTFEEAVNQPLTLIMPARFRNLHLAGLHRVNDGGEHHVIGKTVELVGLRKDGLEFPMDLSLSKWETRQGKFYTGIIRDVSDRKQSEKALNEAETIFRQAIEAAGAVPYQREHGTNKYLYMGEGIKDILGYSAAEMDAALLDSLVIKTEMSGPLEDTRFDEAIQNARTGKIKKWHANIHLRTRDGGSRWVADSSAELLDDNGLSVGSLGFMQDITQRKQTEEYLRHSEANFRNLVENAPEAIVIVDLETGLFAEPNENAARLYGLPREELIKVGPADMSPPFQPDGRPSTEAAMEKIGQAMQGAKPIFDWIHRNAQGQDFPCEVRLTRLPTEHPMVRASVTDISVRKQSEALLAQRAAELQAVADISIAASTAAQEQDMLETVVNLAKTGFDLYHAHIYLLDSASEYLVLSAGAGEIGKQMVAAGRTIPLNHPHSLVARAARTAAGAIANDVTLAPDFLPNPLLPDTRSELATPIIAGNTVLGVFDVQSNVANRFTDDDIAIETTLARQVGAALQNVRSLKRAEQAIAELDALTRRLVREGWTEYQHRELAREHFVYDLPQTHGSNGHTGRLSEPTTVASALTVRGESIGELELANPVERAEAEAITQAIAERLSAHIENLRLTEQTQLALSQAQKRAVEIQTVAEVTTVTATILERNQLLERAVELTQRRFNLYHCHIFLFDPDTNSLNIAACGWRDDHQQAGPHGGRTILLAQERSLVAHAARTRKAVAVNDVSQADNWLPNAMLPETRSEVAIPMMVGDTLIGVFDAQSEKINRFGPEDVQAFVILSTAVAIAVQNAQLYSDQINATNRLREMDRLKSTFLANMSHELRTPLNSVIGYTDVILEGLDGPLTEPMEVDLRTIQRNGQHLLNLINDVLDMAKIESGKLSLAVRPFDLRDVLTDIIDITSPLARDRNVELRLETFAPNLHMEGDDMRLRQVVLNVVNNAIKFTDSGGEVAIQAERIDDRIRVKIKDNGIGIPPDKLDLIFQEFTQVDASTTRKVGGTGLGLPISRHLIALHGGRLWAESTGLRGEGSTFTFEVPVESQIGEEN